MTKAAIEIDRREFLTIGAGGALAFTSLANAAPRAKDDFSAFMAALEQIGDQLPVDTRAEQDAYIYGLAARALRMKDFPVPKMAEYGRTGVHIGRLASTQPPTDLMHGVVLVSYRMAPNAVFRAHNHPNYSVATVGLEGEARFVHYEPEQPAPAMTSTESFTVRRTAERLLRKGDVTTLSPSRDNVHTFRAGPEGARFIDLFSNHGGDLGFSFLQIDPQAIVPGGDSYRAHWISSSEAANV